MSQDFEAATVTNSPSAYQPLVLGAMLRKAHEEGKSGKKDSPTAFDELEGIVSGEHRDIGG